MIKKSRSRTVRLKSLASISGTGTIVIRSTLDGDALVLEVEDDGSGIPAEILDESPEVDTALYFAASRASHTGGSLVLLYVIEPQDFQHWMF